MTVTPEKVCGCNRRVTREHRCCTACARDLQTVPILDQAWTREQYQRMRAAA